MPDRRRFAIGVTPLLALISVAAAILLPSDAAPAAAQSQEPAVTCFEISVGWRICVASSPEPIAATSPLPRTTLTYGAPVTTGSVTDDGDYAFLTDPDDLTTAITTYEGLRTGLRDGTTIGLVMHQNDGDGASHEAFYDLVRANDVFEWREANGCWMRYVIREVHADPAGDPPRKLLTLQIYSHPYPDTGCTGAIRTTGSRTFTWTPGEFTTGNLPAPVWHGDALWAPRGWSGTLPDAARITPIDTTWPLDPMPAPDLGAAWSGYLSLGYGGVIEGYYGHTDGGVLSVLIYRARLWPGVVMGVATDRATAAHIWELRVIDGWPAAVGYDRVRSDISYAAVDFYDAANGTIYVFHGGSVAQRNDPEALIALARQFLPDAPAGSCQPRAPAGGRSNDSADLGLEDCGPALYHPDLRRPTTTGAVTDDGDYAFLTDPDDLTTLVTTYEGLRDGSTTGLVIHQTDSAGTSQADFYALMEAGDLMEWREAADCFVRYTITEVKDDPAGDDLPPRKLLAVAWMTYAFTGCSGAISSTATARLQWGPLLDLGGTSLTAPVVHGPFQIVPEGWTGEQVPWEQHDPPAYNRDNERFTTDLAIARTFPYWREPALPDHWVLSYARMDAEDLPYGYVSVWLQEAGVGTGQVQIAGGFLWGRNGISEAVEGRGLNETRVIARRPAEISYSHDSPSSVSLIVYDQATEAAYSIRTSNRIFRGENLDALIDLARSLFEPPNAP